VSHANVAAETPPSSVRHQSSHEKRSSPSRMQSASARGFIPVSPIAFSIEFDGMNAVLLDQLSDASLNRIVDELQSVLYDAVRGPVPSKGSIRVERVLASEDSDSRTVVEGFIRGMRSASDRRLAIRLLVSYFRGPSADAIGLRLVQFPALVRDANAVSVRRMYINDVDVALLSLSSAQNSPTNNNNNHQKSLDRGQGSLAAFEARRTKLSMTSNQTQYAGLTRCVRSASYQTQYDIYPKHYRSGVPHQRNSSRSISTALPRQAVVSSHHNPHSVIAKSGGRAAAV
ncbi:Hypothetical protein, putative, partial [Bodo saltans]